MEQLVVIAHTPSPNTQRIGKQLETGIHLGLEDTTIEPAYYTPLEADSSNLHTCKGIILFTPENFGYMSGALKDFFDRTYYQLIETHRGLPYCLIVRAGNDGTGTVRACESIASGLGWKAAQEPLILHGKFRETFLDDAKSYATTFAAGLACGIY